MKITMTLNGVKVEKQIPTSWKEVTFWQFLKLAEAKNDLSAVLSVFTGIDQPTLKKATISNLGKVVELLRFIETEQMDLTLPKWIIDYPVPQNLELESVEQFEDLKLESLKVKDEGIKHYTLLCAIYACQPYDEKEAEKLAPAFMNAPCEEVVAIGNFTLMKLIGLSNPGLSGILPKNSPMRKWRLVIRSWRARLAFTVRYYFWNRKLRSIATSS